MPEEINLDAAQVGKMFVTQVSFEWREASTSWNGNEKQVKPAHWKIGATLSDKPSQYSNDQTMTIKIEQGIGQKLAEVLLPIIIADAPRKAEQLAADSKAMLSALGDRTIQCLTDMPKE